jgi:hypothetical protein
MYFVNLRQFERDVKEMPDALQCDDVHFVPAGEPAGSSPPPFESPNNRAL